MQIESTRFGMRRGPRRHGPHLPGRPDRAARHGSTRCSPQSERSPFYWLHSLESPHVAVPVTTPWLFFCDYEVRVPDDDAGRLGIAESDQARDLLRRPRRRRGSRTSPSISPVR